MAMLSLTALTALGWLQSYTALRDLVQSAAMVAWAGHPAAAVRGCRRLRGHAGRDRRRARWPRTAYAWTLAMAHSPATVAGNMTLARTDHMAQAVHATPAGTMVLARHLPSRFFQGSRAVIRSEGAFLRRGGCSAIWAGHPDAGMAGAGLGSGRMSPRWPAS